MNKKLTVFTPVYNRSKLIIHLFESLCNQTVKDFEWIIIDDGSNDDIAQVVKDFKNKKTGFEIEYFEQKHGGKHRAINYALSKTDGKYFFIVDSDDRLVDNAVELILEWIEQVKARDDIAGIAGLRISQKEYDFWKEKTIDKIEYIECSNLERKRYHLLGDKAEIYKTDILREFPFPEFEGEYFVTENVCWNAIAAAGYVLRWYNVPIYICEYLEDGLTKNGANEVSGYVRNYKGYCYYIKQSMNIVPFKERMFQFYWYNNTRIIMRKPLLNAAEDIGFSIGKYYVNLFIFMPIAYILRKIDKLRERCNPKVP